MNKKQVDDKLYHIERCFKARESACHSGAADQSDWPLEERIAQILGTRIKKYLQLNSGLSDATEKEGDFVFSFI